LFFGIIPVKIPLVASHSPFWKRTALIIAITVAAIAVLVAIFLPTLRRRATENAALFNGKTLGLCCKQYAIDHDGNYPPSLEVLVPKYLPDRIYLASPLRPSEPIGYTYFPGLKDTSPSDAILLKDKFDSRIVIYADDSAKILRNP
jgi:hypothetical protein